MFEEEWVEIKWKWLGINTFDEVRDTKKWLKCNEDNLINSDGYLLIKTKHPYT